MVKHLQQANSCISSAKRVSFRVDCKSEDYPLADEEVNGVSDVIQGNDIERLLKVMQALNATRMGSVERFAEISQLMNTDRNEIFGGPKRISSEVNLQKHRNECLDISTRIARNSLSGQNDVSRVAVAKEVGLRTPRSESCRHLALAPLACPPSQPAAGDGLNCLGEVARKPAVLRFNSVDGLTDDDAQSSGESTAADDTGSGSSSRRGSGDSIQIPQRGYSSQRRHGRKDSLGTVDFTRLIPTLVSDNEEFRHKEYQRKLSVQPIELQQNTW